MRWIDNISGVSRQPAGKDCASHPHDITEPIGASRLPLRRSIAVSLLRAFKVQQMSDDSDPQLAHKKTSHEAASVCHADLWYDAHAAGQGSRRRAESRCNPTRRETVMNRHRWRFTAPQQWYIKCKQIACHPHTHGCIPIPWSRPVAPGSRCRWWGCTGSEGVQHGGRQSDEVCMQWSWMRQSWSGFDTDIKQSREDTFSMHVGHKIKINGHSNKV